MNITISTVFFTFTWSLWIDFCFLVEILTTIIIDRTKKMQWFLMISHAVISHGAVSVWSTFQVWSMTSEVWLVWSSVFCSALGFVFLILMMNSSFFGKGNNLWLSNANCLSSIKWYKVVKFTLYQCYKVVKFTASGMWRSICGRVVLCGNIIDQ